MSREFDLKLNFPVGGLENIDKANAKLAEVSKNIDAAAAKVRQVSAATSQAANQAAYAASQSAKQAAAAMQQSIKQTQQALQQLLQAAQQVNAQMGKMGQGGGAGQPPRSPGQPPVPPRNNPGGGGGGQQQLFTLSGIMRGVGFGYGGYQIIRTLATELKNLLPQAAQNARQLQNLSEEMGITAQQAFRLQTSAKLVGVDLGTMGMAARKLGDALNDPGVAGKKTAKALGDLGVSMRQGLGGALDDVIHKLAGIEDPAKRAQLAFELFGRSGAQINIVAENLKQSEETMRSWGLSLDTNVQQKLVDANSTLEAMSVRFTLLKAQLATGLILPIVNAMTGEGRPQIPSIPGTSPIGGVGNFPMMGIAALMGTNLFRRYSDPGAPSPVGSLPGVPASLLPARGTRSDARSLLGLLGDGSKGALDDKLAAAKAALASSEAFGNNDANLALLGGDKAPTSQRLAMDKEEIKKGRDLVASLEAQKKALEKNKTLMDEWSVALAKMTERANAVSAGEKGPLASLDEQYATTMQKFRAIGVKPFSKQWTDYTSRYGIVRDSILRAQHEKGADSTLKWNEKLSGLSSNVYNDQGKYYSNSITNGLREGDPLTKMLFGPPQITALPPGFSASQNAQLRRLAASGTARIGATLAGPGQQGAVAAQTLQLRLQEVEAARQEATEQAKILEGTKQVNAVMTANFEARKGQYEAVIQYEERLAEIKKSQLDETRSFTSGLFRAGISGQPGAGGNFLRSWATNMASTVVGNLGAETIGTMNSHLSLQKDPGTPGMLGTAKNPNFLGKLLSGTPFGLDPAKGDSQAAPLNLNTQVTQANTAATASLSQVIASLTGVMGTASGVSTATLPGMAGSGVPSILPASSGSGVSSLDDLINNAPIGGAGPNDVYGMPSLPSVLGHANLPAFGAGASTTTGAGKLQGLVGGIGSLLSGAGTVASGRALGGVLTGGIDFGNGTGTALSGMQRVGAAAGLAGGTYAGVSDMLKSFSHGGGQGITGGIGSALGTASMFAGPAAPFLAAGGTLMKVISSLFGDPRQNRITNEQHTLVHDAFVQPAAHDYNFGGSGSGGSGFSYADGGAIRAGGANANYSVQISAMDAKSFVDWTHSNPQTMQTAMLYAVQNGGVAAWDQETALRAANTGFFG